MKDKSEIKDLVNFQADTRSFYPNQRMQVSDLSSPILYYDGPSSIMVSLRLDAHDSVPLNVDVLHFICKKWRNVNNIQVFLLEYYGKYMYFIYTKCGNLERSSRVFVSLMSKCIKCIRLVNT